MTDKNIITDLWQRLWATREPINGLTHFIGGVVHLFSMLWMLWYVRESVLWLGVVLIYGLGTMALFFCSTLMHWSYGMPQRLLFYRRLDHAAIFLMIAGHYTLYIFYLLRSPIRELFFLTVWCMALAGVFFKMTRLGTEHSRFTIVPYLAMGWLGLMLFPLADSTVHRAILPLVLISGLIFSAGAIIYALKRPTLHPQIGSHEIWHFFTLAGFGLQAYTIAAYVLPAALH